MAPITPSQALKSVLESRAQVSKSQAAVDQITSAVVSAQAQLRQDQTAHQEAHEAARGALVKKRVYTLDPNCKPVYVLGDDDQVHEIQPELVKE